MEEYIKNILKKSNAISFDILKKSILSDSEIDMNAVCGIIKKYAKSSFVLLEDDITIKVLYIHRPIVQPDGIVASCHVNYII